MYGNIQKGCEMMPTVIPREVAVCGTHSGHSVVENDEFKNNNFNYHLPYLYPFKRGIKN